MRDDLLLYYEQELSYLRQQGVLFAEKYPVPAGRLMLGPGGSADPHVERLIEAVAFLSARVHLKIDDEFPEITESLLGIVYPHFIRPLPSMTIVQFHLDPEKGKLTAGFPIERHTQLYSKQLVDGVQCKFRTCYDTTLWPISVTGTNWTTPDRLKPPLKAVDAAAALVIKLECTAADMELGKLELDQLRFFLDGESSLVHTLYELLCCNLLQIVVRDATPGSRIPAVTLPPAFLRPVGFAEDEEMLPYPRRSFAGYRLLQEYFTFPEKFFFLDVTGLRQAMSGFKRSVELVFLTSRLEGDERRQRLENGIPERTFCLGCSPVINLFPHTAEPIRLDQQKHEYTIMPDAKRPHALEVFSVEQVVSLKPQQQDVVEYQPFYSYRHSAERERPQTFWIANRRASLRANDEGTDIDLAMVDLSLRPSQPPVDALTVRTRCTNRDLPLRLFFRNEKDGDFELEKGAPVKLIVALKKPTSPVRPPLGKAMQWRLISHLSLNYLSLVSEGRESLQEILKLYDFTGSASASLAIEGITGIKSSRQVARVVSEDGVAFARGTRVEMELDEQKFVGGGVFLFASVIEYFLGLYASLNSFSQLTARVQHRKEVLREWAPRAGRKILM